MVWDAATAQVTIMNTKLQSTEDERVTKLYRGDASLWRLLGDTGE